MSEVGGTEREKLKGYEQPRAGKARGANSMEDLAWIRVVERREEEEGRGGVGCCMRQNSFHPSSPPNFTLSINLHPTRHHPLPTILVSSTIDTPLPLTLSPHHHHHRIHYDHLYQPMSSFVHHPSRLSNIYLSMSITPRRHHHSSTRHRFVPSPYHHSTSHQ